MNALTWTRNETDGHLYSQNGLYRISRVGTYYQLHYQGTLLNDKRLTQTKCKELAEQHETKLAELWGQQEVQTQVQLNVAEDENIFLPDPPKVQPKFVLIGEYEYPATFGQQPDGKATATLSSPEGNDYGLVLDGKDSTCSCPSFEHRRWCKHLTALVGERNAVFGTDAAPVKHQPALRIPSDGMIEVVMVPTDPAGITVYSQDAELPNLRPEPIRNVVNAPMPRPEVMPSAESRRKVKPSNTESTPNSTDSVIRSTIAQDATEPENRPDTQLCDLDAVRNVLDAAIGLSAGDEPDIVRDEEPKGRGGVEGQPKGYRTVREIFNTVVPQPNFDTSRTTRSMKVFAAALETLQPGTKFRHGRFRGELIDVNAGDAKVRIKEPGSNWTEAHWSPATLVKIGENLEELTPAPTMDRDGTGTSGADDEGKRESGGSAMKIQRAEFELLLGELGLPAAKSAKMTIKELTARIGKIPDRAKGKEVAEASQSLLKRLCKAVEDGEEVEVVGEEPATAGKKTKPVTVAKGKEGKSKKPVKAESNGHANGNGHAKPKKPTKEGKRPKIMGKYAVGPFVRWLGRQGVAFEGARSILSKEQKGNLSLSDPSIKWELKERRENKPAAEVDKEDAKAIREKYAKAFAS